ncbi:MAG: DNA polymerase I [Rickettsiales bacterium]|nr:DNA polymerase I [Rickettsiales bacterium]
MTIGKKEMAESQKKSRNESPPPRLVLVDGSGYIFRAFHALPPLTRGDGTPVGAVYGFTNMMLKLREQFAGDHLVVIFDASRRSFRQEIYPDYKAHRPPAPEDLVPQFALVREATAALGIPAIELENFEADDLIASYAESAKREGIATIIVSSDKDLMQLITPEVQMLDPMKQKPIGAAEVKEKFGVTPDKVIEVQALIGDATDNVPGVPGIGPKTAAELIHQFGDVETLLASIDQIKQPKRRESLTAHAEDARLSRRLVELKRDIPLPRPIDDLHAQPLNLDVLLPFLTAQRFTSLIKKFGGGEESRVESRESSGKNSKNVESDNSVSSLFSPSPSFSLSSSSSTHSTLDSRLSTLPYITIRDATTLIQWVKEAQAQGFVALDTETTSLHAMDAELVGVSLALAPGQAAYLPLGHLDEDSGAGEGGGALPQNDLFSAAPTRKLAEGQMNRAEALAILAPLLSDAGVLKIGHNIKYDMVVLGNDGLTVAPIADTMLMSYALSAGLNNQGLDELAAMHCGHKMISFVEVTGSGKSKKRFDAVSIETATNYAAEDADFTLRLYEILKPQLVSAQVLKVYESIDRPIIPAIVAMERAGIAIDTKKLAALSQLMMGKITRLEQEIQDLAGMPFAVGSPKQLGEVLYEKMQLAGGKKSAKSGAYTTDAETLEALAAQGHVIAEKVLEWRHMSKLKSTYTDSLPEAISPKTGRIHTSFSLAVTTTGRLSSSDPNLQNIPIRTELGREIREAFVAASGCVLLSADYSQIELRLLAHMADIPTLKDAFHHGADIHAITASQMFGVPVAQVDSELRRKAKTINFGIIYGISAHGLSVRLGIPRSEAANYIERYFAQYPGIREYMDRTVEFARAHGYVSTLFGRKVHVRNINAKQANLRHFSERAAINAPLQGTAADIIKRAMVAVHGLLEPSGQPPVARLLLQVHDELVIEAPETDSMALALKVKAVMERAASLSVPLTVEVGIGKNWGET